MRSWHIFKIVFNIPFSPAIVVRQDLYNITKEPTAFSLTDLLQYTLVASVCAVIKAQQPGMCGAHPD